MISILSVDKKILGEFTVFSDKTTNFKLINPSDIDPERNLIVRILRSRTFENILWELLLVIDAVKNYNPKIKIILMIDYLPNARADRVFEEGNSLPLQVFFKSILAYENIHEVIVVDPHSDIEKYFSDSSIKLTVIDQTECFMETLQKKNIRKYSTLVYPDKGAFQKTNKIAERIGAYVIGAKKQRDLSTGKIIDIDLDIDPEYLNQYVKKHKTFIIVDDICDGGGTFIPIAQKLKSAGAKSVALYVTHGIFSKGLDIFEDDIDEIFAYQIVCDYVTRNCILDFNYRKHEFYI